MKGFIENVLINFPCVVVKGGHIESVWSRNVGVLSTKGETCAKIGVKFKIIDAIQGNNNGAF